MKVSKFIVVVLVGLAMVMLGCAGEEPTKVEKSPTPPLAETTTPTVAPTQTPTPTPTVSELKLKVGESAQTSRLEVTVKDVFKTKVISGDYGNYWAEDGKVFIFAVVNIKNIDTELKAWYVGPSDFAMSDETGRRYDVRYMSVDGYFEGGDLNPNEYREGLIAFEVPENVKTIKIKYDFGGLFGVKLATWEANMDEIPTKEPKVKILGGEVKYKTSILGYQVERVTINVKNEGELPIYLSKVEIKYGTKDWKTLGYPDKILKPSEEKTIEETEFEILDSKPAVVEVRFVDDEHVIAEGSI